VTEFTCRSICRSCRSTRNQALPLARADNSASAMSPCWLSCQIWRQRHAAPPLCMPVLPV
jgi:hypothetical protein